MTLRQKICDSGSSTLREFLCKELTGGTKVVYSREHSIEAELQEHSIEVEKVDVVLEASTEKSIFVKSEDVEVEKIKDKEVYREC